jgi:hypothetical protein
MKPHRQSEYMVGYKAPPSTEVSGRLALTTAAAVILFLVALNVFFPEPESVSCGGAAQVVANQK